MAGTHSRKSTLWRSPRAFGRGAMEGEEVKGRMRRDGVRGDPLLLCVTRGCLFGRTLGD